ncbi:hypothetical protein OPV22_001961 [Ensete ventricosum]|uniref:Uncharacterized protein n=1 Tax=Ensete ventricosum TaxID=4639 RepID=A0AAV8RRB7_ENSVE|nr:hypothetical protein OPV22_001961 [Ensete ventricosum]
MDDSVDASESVFVSLSSILKKPEDTPNGGRAADSDEEAEETMAAKKRDVMDSSLKGGAEEVDDGVGFIGRLVSNLTVSVPGGSVEDNHKKEEEEEEEEEEKDSTGGGLINHLFPNLPVTMPDEQSPSADEASLLISIIED